MAESGLLDLQDIAVRLGLAAAIGGTIGLNRDLNGKPIGLRTLGLVGLGSALVVLAAGHFDDTTDVNAASRAIQGVITGIGFLGAGVILKEDGSNRIHGLTTAASIWLTSCLGIVCGVGAWRVAMIALIITFALLVFGGPLERQLHQWLRRKRQDEPPS